MTCAWCPKAGLSWLVEKCVGVSVARSCASALPHSTLVHLDFRTGRLWMCRSEVGGRDRLSYRSTAVPCMAMLRI